MRGEGLLLRSPVGADRERWLELYRDPDELRYGLPAGLPVPGSLEALDPRVAESWLTIDEDGPAQAWVQLDHSVENEASCRTALAAGFVREGVRASFLPLRDETAPDGVRRHDVCLHGLVPDP